MYIKLVQKTKHPQSIQLFAPQKAIIVVPYLHPSVKQNFCDLRWRCGRNCAAHSDVRFQMASAINDWFEVPARDASTTKVKFRKSNKPTAKMTQSRYYCGFIYSLLGALFNEVHRWLCMRLIVGTNVCYNICLFFFLFQTCTLWENPHCTNQPPAFLVGIDEIQLVKIQTL